MCESNSTLAGESSLLCLATQAREGGVFCKSEDTTLLEITEIQIRKYLNWNRFSKQKRCVNLIGLLAEVPEGWRGLFFTLPPVAPRHLHDACGFHRG